MLNREGDSMPTPKKKQDCYQCIHRYSIPGDFHSGCNNISANVIGDEHGIDRGWFLWPFNFDPLWLESCDGFERNIL